MKTTVIDPYLTEIVHSLRHLATNGCTGFDLSNKTLELLNGWGKGPPLRCGETLSDIHYSLNGCSRCGLHSNRQNIVFGDGNPRARLVFVGEGPGADEDRQGQPFVGAAGQLLTRIIEAMGLTREEVYICNVVKCRPPGNRNPLPEEINACAPFLSRQIQSIGPEYICALGKFAAQFLLGAEVPISALRGRFFKYNGIPVMPTYHPAFLLRSPEKKREVWEDMKKIMHGLGLPIPPPKKGDGA